MQVEWVNQEWRAIQEVFNNIIKDLKEIDSTSTQQFDITITDSDNGYILSLWGYKLELSCRTVVKEKRPEGFFECKFSDETILSFSFDSHYGEVEPAITQEGIQLNFEMRQQNAHHRLMKVIALSLLRMIRT